VSEEPPLIGPAAGALMAVVGVVAFCALLVLLTYASSLETGNNGGGHALSKSAIGFSGLAQALRDLNEPVLISRHRLPEGRNAGLYVLTPPLQAAAKDILKPPKDLGDETTLMGFEGPVLVVTPKWMAAPDPKHRGWVSGGQPAPSIFFGKESIIGKARVARRTGVSRPTLTPRAGPFVRPLTFGAIDSFQTMDLADWKGWTPVLVDETGKTVMAKAPWGPAYLLSDPDLLDNQGLKDMAGFTGAVTLANGLRAENGPVMFDVTLNGLGVDRSALNLMFDPPFLAVTLCLAVAAALAGWQAFCRFGPARREGRAVAHGKEALVDNTAALVRLARKETALGGDYAELTRQLAARAVGAPRTLTGEALNQFLDRLAARRGAAESLNLLTLAARTAADRGRLTDAARKLYRWRTEMTGEG
jgi:hypothetical protein